jgi:hypothetical protein
MLFMLMQRAATPKRVVMVLMQRAGEERPAARALMLRVMQAVVIQILPLELALTLKVTTPKLRQQQLTQKARVLLREMKLIQKRLLLAVPLLKAARHMLRAFSQKH